MGNTFLTAESSVPLMAMGNRNLKSRKKHAVDHKEFGPLVRIINGLCYYGCSIADVEKHPDTHPLVANAVQNLRGSTMKQKFKRLNLLLRSLDGTKPKTKKSNNDETLQRILQARSAASLRAGRKLEVLLSPTMVRGDPLEERSKTIFNETPSRKLIV